MATSNGSPRRFTGLVPIPGMLLSGLGTVLLFVYWTVPAIGRGLSANVRVVWIVTSLLLVVWGAWLTASGASSTHGFGFSRHRMLLPRQGVVYLLMMAVMFVGALLGRTNMLMLVFAMMSGPFVLNGWITFSMLKRIRVARAVPRRTMAGDPVSVEIVFSNERFWLSSWLMTVTDAVTNAREFLAPHVLFARVPCKSQRAGQYQLRLMQRGRYRFGPLRVSTRFPLGLVERGVRFDEFDEILVHPRLGHLAPAWKRNHLVATELVHRRQLRRGVFDDEFHSIREFRSGDNPRAIHWRTSARRNQLMIREYHQSRDRNLVVILDLWQPEMPAAYHRSRVELAVSLAATITVAQMRESRDSRITLLCAGRELVKWEGQSSAAGIESLLDTLAVVEAAATTDLIPLAEESRRHAVQNAAMVIVTSRPDPNRHSPGPESGGREAVNAVDSAIEPRTRGATAVLESPATKTAGPWEQLADLSDASGRLQLIEADPAVINGFFRMDIEER